MKDDGNNYNNNNANDDGNADEDNNHEDNEVVVIEPILVNTTTTTPTTTTTTTNMDHQQIDLDTSRSSIHLLSGNQNSKLFQMKYKQRKRIQKILKKRQRRLGDFIKLTLGLSGSSCIGYEDGFSSSATSFGGVMRVDEDDGVDEDEEEKEMANSRNNQRLRYYQGYHDVGSIILSTLGGVGAGGNVYSNAATTTTATPRTATTCDDDDREGRGNNSISSSRVDNGRSIHDDINNDKHENTSMMRSSAAAAAKQQQQQQPSSNVESPTSILSVDLLTSTSPNHHRHRTPDPHQGDYHTLMTTASSMGLALACHVLLRLSHSHFRDAMKSDFTHLQAALRLIVLPMIATFDPQLHSYLTSSGLDEPYFCLSWVITWFTHDIHDTDLVKRIFDFFIVSHPLMAVYTSVAMVLHPVNRAEVLGVVEESGGDFACVHGALANLPRNSWCSVAGTGGGDGGGWEMEQSSPSSPGRRRVRESNSTDGATTSNGVGHGRGQDNDSNDAASCDPSLQDTLSINNDWSDYGNKEEEEEESGREARVPFQELIDLSITLM